MLRSILRRQLFGRRTFTTAKPLIYKSPFPEIDLPLKTAWEIVQENSKDILHKPALICGVTHETTTYGEFIKNVQKIATSLSLRGIKKGDVRDNIISRTTSRLSYV